MKTVTVFVGCDFYYTGPRKILDKFLRRFSNSKVRVVPIFSCSNNTEIVKAYGAGHPEIDVLTGSDGLMGQIYALIKNSDMVVFDLTGYRPRRKYCLNVIYELGVALPFAKELRPERSEKLTWRFFAKRGLKYHKDISDLSGDQPLFFGYRDLAEMKELVKDNLAPLIYLKQGGKMSRKPVRVRRR
jgi:hypothetical protein